MDERSELGRSRRSVLPRSALAELVGSRQRPDPITLLESQAMSRIPELVPIRYGRMLASPWAFSRGAALIMASELGSGPHSGLGVQLCGDAHLCNFGLFGSAERNLVFDINDFSHSPGALPPDALIDPDTISDIVVWLARDASSLVTAAQIPADKGYLKV